MSELIIIGGGLAGCEAAWQAARQHCRVTLYDMKPERFSPAHTASELAELVCSNSFRSDAPDSAVGLLKEEMRQLNSLLMRVAEATRVPAGKALAVDRERFAAEVTREICSHPLIRVIRKEITSFTDHPTKPIIVATGPLTSEPLTEQIVTLTGRERLAFYDAIAPIVAADSLDMEIIYAKSRYDDGPGDYLNCPFSQEEYTTFISTLGQAQCVPLKSFEEPKYFEGCLPVEVICSRGPDTLRYGPMKPVGLADPRTGLEPYAVVQLRKENLAGTAYNLVGFQTKLTYREQDRVFRLIPGLAQVEFVRYGSIHRNTFVCAPEVLEPTLELRRDPRILLAGQLSGVEGYVESAAMGLLAGINGARKAHGQKLVIPPAATAMGALVNHLTQTDPRYFQPSNINFGLFPAWEKKVPKRLRGGLRRQQALQELTAWQEREALR